MGNTCFLTASTGQAEDADPVQTFPKIEKETCLETVPSGEPLLKRFKPAPPLSEDEVDDHSVPVFLRVQCAEKPALEDFYELCSFQKNDRPVWTDGQNYIYCTKNLQWAVAMDEDGVNGDRGWLYDNLGGADTKYPNSVRMWKLYDGNEWNSTVARIHVSPPAHINIECSDRREVNGCYVLIDPAAEQPMWGSGQKRLYLNGATSHWAICLQEVTAKQGGGVVRSAADVPVMTEDSRIQWPNAIYDWDYHDGEGWTRASTRVTATKRPPPPRLLVVCKEKPDIDGTYKVCREKINGFAAWRDGDNFIYQTKNKTWAVCMGEDSTQNDRGWLYAKSRESKLPDKVSEWDAYSGSEWKSSPESSIAIPDKDKVSPPPMAVYKPDIAEEVETGINDTRKAHQGLEDSAQEDPAGTETSAAPTRMGDASENDIRILPNTAWHEIKPTRGTLEELGQNPGIRKSCAKIGSIVDDIEMKTQELKFARLPVKLDDNHLAAIVAYTHDVQDASRTPQGNIYFEMNKALRSRNTATRQVTMRDWGPFVHYLIMGLSKLPDYSGECFRGYPNKKEVLKEYELGRPIQWGAFASVTVSFEAAKSFTDKKTGVIFKIAVTSGRQIQEYSFFPDENEVLLTPSHRFTVASEPYQKDGYTCIYLIQQRKSEFVS